MKEVIIACFILINSAEFILSGADKKAAIRHGRRVPEKTLWIVALLGGSIGLFLSMRIFHHKTKHMVFVIGAPILAAVHVILLILFLGQTEL